jgi:hypothetical protein
MSSSEQETAEEIVVQMDTNSIDTKPIDTKSIDTNKKWKRHIRLKPKITEKFDSFDDFIKSEMSKGRNGFRTRPGMDKYMFEENQDWFPKTRGEQILCGKALVKEMMLIPAIKDRFYVKGYLNPANSHQNSSDKDIFELHIMDLIPKSSSSVGQEISSVNPNPKTKSKAKPTFKKAGVKSKGGVPAKKTVQFKFTDTDFPALYKY